MADRPSERVLDQRLRNRVVEALEVLAQGDDGVRTVGNVDYVNYFFDVVDDSIPDKWPGKWREWSTFTPSEVRGIEAVQQLLRSACSATPRVCSDQEFIASGWPERIRPVAAETVALMRERGLFDEDHEEASPSN